MYNTNSLTEKPLKKRGEKNAINIKSDKNK